MKRQCKRDEASVMADILAYDLTKETLHRFGDGNTDHSRSKMVWGGALDRNRVVYLNKN